MKTISGIALILSGIVMMHKAIAWGWDLVTSYWSLPGVALIIIGYVIILKPYLFDKPKTLWKTIKIVYFTGILFFFLVMSGNIAYFAVFYNINQERLFYGGIGLAILIGIVLSIPIVITYIFKGFKKTFSSNQEIIELDDIVEEDEEIIELDDIVETEVGEKAVQECFKKNGLI